jgi:hypothetical protein
MPPILPILGYLPLVDLHLPNQQIRDFRQSLAKELSEWRSGAQLLDEIIQNASLCAVLKELAITAKEILTETQLGYLHLTSHTHLSE